MAVEPDADRILWANPAGAAIFDAASPREAALLRFDARHSASVQVVRLSGTLPHGSAPRLERLRGFGASIGATIVCLCSRVTLADNSAAILIASAERSRKSSCPPGWATRLLRDFGPAAAISTADGEIIAAQPAAIERMGNQRDLVALGAERLAREASLNGMAEGEIRTGRMPPSISSAWGRPSHWLVVFTEPADAARSGARTNAVADTPKYRIPLNCSFNRVRSVSSGKPTPDALHADKPGIRRSAGLEWPLLGRSWAEIAKTLTLDPSGEIANALSRHETFSGT